MNMNRVVYLIFISLSIISLELNDYLALGGWLTAFLFALLLMDIQKGEKK